MRIATPRRRPVLVPSLIMALGTVALAAIGWGSLRGLLAHPARAAGVVAMFIESVAIGLSDLNFSTGTRSGPHGGWSLGLAMVIGPLVAVIAPYMDRHELWVVDGDAVRWLGVALLVAGGALRVWPMFVLGRRFSAFVAIQEHHALVTDGLYSYIRHPSYLGGLIGFVGWVLVFRSAICLLFAGVLVWPTIARIHAEEVLLSSQFGALYEDYRARTWRLVPFVY
jgi:protein-S-isoprenylcysteine O-methyltransferase Ste14